MMLSDMKVAVTKRTSVPEEVILQKKKNTKNLRLRELSDLS